MFYLPDDSHPSSVFHSSAGATPTPTSVADKLYSLVYVSSAVDELSKESLSGIAEWSMSRNALLGVTGLLLYSGGNFMQCLEGPKESIDILMQSIYFDHRHSGIFVLLLDEISRREFPEWGMAVRSPDAGLTTMARFQLIDVWLNTTIDQQEKSLSRVVLENFWRRVDKRNCYLRHQDWQRFGQENGASNTTANTLGLQEELTGKQGTFLNARALGPIRGGCTA